MNPDHIVEGMLIALLALGVGIVLGIPIMCLLIWGGSKTNTPSNNPPVPDEEEGYAKFTPDGCAYLDLKDPRTLAKLKEVIEDFNKPTTIDDFNLPEDIKRDIKRHRYTREEINANWEKAKKMIEEKRTMEEEMIGK